MPLRYVIRRDPQHPTRFRVEPESSLPSWTFELEAPDCYDDIEVQASADMSQLAAFELFDVPIVYRLVSSEEGSSSLRA